MNTHTFTVAGQVPSKSNRYRIVTVAGHATLAKTKATRAYEEAFFLQCPIRGAMIDTRFALTVKVYFTSDRPDIDNALKAILDCLQTCKAIKNDRLCAEIHAAKFVDKANPRTEVTLTQLI